MKLQYSNHYIIALSCHLISKLATTTLMGFQAIGAEIFLIR